MWFSRYQPNRARRALTAALAAGLAIIMAPRSSIGGIEAWTTDVPIPQGSWNDFEVQFCGNMTDYIQLSASDANTNPFQNGTLSTSYNPTPTASCPNGTTTATFAGGTGSYGNGSTWETGNRAATSNGKIAHFGILNSASSESTGQNWLEADGVLYIPLVLVQPEKENESRCLRDYGLCTIAFDEAWGRCSEPVGYRAASCRPVDCRFVAHPAGYP